MANIIIGRTLWAVSAASESLLSSEEPSRSIKASVIEKSLAALKAKLPRSIKLIATRALVKFARKMKKEHLEKDAQKFETVLDDLLVLLDTADKDAMHLPIEAFQTFSRINEQTVSLMAPKITPKLLTTFKQEHSEGSLGQDLLNLFK